MKTICGLSKLKIKKESKISIMLFYFCRTSNYTLDPPIFILSAVSKLSKHLMLLEVEKQQVQEDLEKSRGEAQKNMREVQVLQARLQDAITWDEHCSIAGKLRR